MARTQRGCEAEKLLDDMVASKFKIRNKPLRERFVALVEEVRATHRPALKSARLRNDAMKSLQGSLADLEKIRDAFAKTADRIAKISIPPTLLSWFIVLHPPNLKRRFKSVVGGGVLSVAGFFLGRW